MGAPHNAIALPIEIYKRAYYVPRMTESLGFLLSDVSRLLRRRFDERARTSGASVAQWRVLKILARSPGLNQGQLAEALEVEPITACRMIDRLEEAGFVERRRDLPGAVARQGGGTRGVLPGRRHDVDDFRERVVVEHLEPGEPVAEKLVGLGGDRIDEALLESEMPL